MAIDSLIETLKCSEASEDARLDAIRMLEAQAPDEAAVEALIEIVQAYDQELELVYPEPIRLAAANALEAFAPAVLEAVCDFLSVGPFLGQRDYEHDPVFMAVERVFGRCTHAFRHLDDQSLVLEVASFLLGRKPELDEKLDSDDLRRIVCVCNALKTGLHGFDFSGVAPENLADLIDSYLRLE